MESVTGIADVFEVAAPKEEPAITQPPAAETTTAVVDTPAKEVTPANVAAETVAPVFDESKYLSELSETWKSKDDAKATLERLKNLETVEQEYGKYKEETKGLIKAANPFVEKVNEIISKNPSQLGTFLKVSAIGDIDKLTPDQAVKLQMEWNGLTKEQADFKTNRKYLLSQTEEAAVEAAIKAGGDEGEAREAFRALKQDAQIDLEIDAKAAREFLKKEQVNASTVPDVQAEWQTKEKARIDTWTPEIPKIVSELKTIDTQVKFKTLTGEEKTIDVNYEISKSEMVDIEKNVLGAIKALPQIGFSKEGIELVKNIALDRAKMNSEDKRRDALIKQVIDARDDEWKLRTTGKKTTVEEVVTNGVQKDAMDLLLESKLY